MKLNDLRDQVHQLACEKGWHQEKRPFGELIALMHSELSEALEEFRNGYEPTDIYYSCSRKASICNTIKHHPHMCEGCKDKKPEGIPIELADCIIRILDYCGSEGIDIEEAIRIKHEFNKNRSWRHNGKKI